MGYWANTTYVNHGSVSEIAAALVGVCEAEGMELMPAPPERERLLVEPMQYDTALRNDLWGIAIFPGAASWTVIQTAPLELLAERAAGAAQMRLADLCRRLRAPALQINVYDSTGEILVEVSDEGQVSLSGCNMQSGAADPFDWCGERLSEDLFEAQFQLHPFQHLLADAELGEDKARAISLALGAQNSTFCDNLVSVDTLICHKPFTASGGVTLYLRWPGASRQRFSPCASWAEYRTAIKSET